MKLRFVTFLTFVRLPLVLVFVAGALLHTWWPRTWVFVVAFAALATSAVTDLLDGYFARRFNVETELGAHADPLMDKFFSLSALPTLIFIAAHNGHTRHAMLLVLMTVLFLGRDQWVTFLRSIGSIYQAPGGAKWTGKLRTCINLPLLCAIYYYEESPLPVIPRALLGAAEAAAIMVSVISLFTYTGHYWPYLRRSLGLNATKNTRS